MASGQNAGLTIATTLVEPEEASRFGVTVIGEDGLISGFEEKPAHVNAVRSPFDPERVSASMGIYLFDTGLLLEELCKDAEEPNSAHDFGRDIIPRHIGRTRVAAYDFRDLNDKRSRYWRDVGTLDAYYDANMDLVAVTPEFNLYDRNWPIRTRPVLAPPAKFVFAQEGRRMGIALDSIVSQGSIVSGGRVLRSVLSTDVRIESYAEIEDSILLENVRVGRYCRIRRAIIDAGVELPDSTVIGHDLEADRAAGHHVTASGIVVVSDFG